MMIKNTAYSYDKQKVKYSANRQTDPVIAGLVQNALGDAVTVLNVGAGTGNYEPANRIVTAVEPSEVMRAQRSPNKPAAVAAFAESLPFNDNSFDASMAMLTLHHWSDIKQGLLEMKRVTSRRIVILTFEPETVGRFWLADYCPEVVDVDKNRFPKIEFITDTLGGKIEVVPVAVPINCIDGFNEAFYGRPEAFLDDSIRRSQSFWDFLPRKTELKAVSKLKADLESGKWDNLYGHLRSQAEFHGALRLVVSQI
ncbi:MAG TPA: class I SAM-dependent methyltransferase [Ignavibacteria bacterium]|nr:class I SAM-dependent methyltransferase [Ignavibacteria bacterium]HRF65356.1 class I SAM-dependent methyltransferase [Ignavibacteria bacterium]HRJ04233.1 class I SAM-dependent methyltransferase [Ignavibacteria bacterium]